MKSSPSLVKQDDHRDGSSRCFLAVDLGATSGRTVLGKFDGKRLDMQEWSRFRNPMLPMNGHLFWDLPALYGNILDALRKLAAEGIEIESIGIDTWGCDFALFGADGTLLSLPYCYRDCHTEGACENFFDCMPKEEVYKLTGIQFMDFNSLFQLYTLRNSGCTALKHAEKIMFIPDALVYLLTGEFVTEYTVATTSQLVNSHEKDLSGELLEAIGLKRDRFGKMVLPGTSVGTLSEQVRKATGMGAVKVVAVAGHDTASAVAAVPAEDNRFAYLSCGTWSLLGVEIKQPVITDESLRLNFTNEGGIDGTVRFLKNICGLWLMERCRGEFVDIPADVNELNGLCTQSNFEGLINPDDSLFANPDSMTKAIVDYCRKTGQDAPQCPADFLRCIFRSLALRYRQVLDMLKSLVPSVKIDKLHVIGGGSKNTYLMQMTADAVGLPVICGPAECTAMGNLLVQARSAGLVASAEEMRLAAANSVKTVTYNPTRGESWEDLYRDFLRLTN